MINVLGDALAAGIMAHVCRKDFAQDTGTEVRTVPPSQPGCPKTRGWSRVGGGQGSTSATHQLGSPRLIPPRLVLIVGTRVTDSPNSKLLSTHCGQC